MDLSHLTLEELNTLSNDIKKAIEARRQDAEKQLLDDIRQKAQQLGLTADQLINKVRDGKKAAGPAVAAKYRHPETKAEWSGRGRKPLWVTDWIENGRSLDELAIA